MKATYVNLSDKERDILKQFASKNNITISSCIRQIILPILTREIDFLDSEKLELDLDALEDFSVDMEDFQAAEKRNNRVYVYFSDEEIEYIKKAARGRPISSYVRYRLLRSAAGRFEFIVSTEDIKELTKQNDELNMHFAGFVGGLQFRNSVNTADFQYCQQLLREINENTAELKKAVLKNRYSIRQQGRRYLEKQIRAILGKSPNEKTSNNKEEQADVE